MYIHCKNRILPSGEANLYKSEITVNNYIKMFIERMIFLKNIPAGSENDNPNSENMPNTETVKKEKNVMKKFKIAYAFAVVLALCGALAAKIATEKSLGSLNVPLENKYTVNVTEKETGTPVPEMPSEKSVHENINNVPDTREFDKQAESTENMSADKKSKDKTKSKNKEESTTASPYAKPYEGYFALPAGMKIGTEYSENELIYSKTMGDWRTHTGVDFACAEGEQIKAIAYGKVKSVTDDVFYGCTVEIDHGNGVTARYCGFNKETVTVKKGGTVKSGDLLGYLGTVPCEKADGAHLHFEISYNGKTVEPLELMGK